MQTKKKMGYIELDKHVLTSSLKEHEQKLLAFYKRIGERLGRNKKSTEIFVYLMIHQELTQKQLKDLTNFSYSTISTCLNYLVQINAIQRKLIPKTHLSLYSLKGSPHRYTYQDLDNLNDRFTFLEDIIEEIENKLTSLKGQYPIKSEFLYRRLNGVLNYVSIQKMRIVDEINFEFLIENTNNIFLPNQIMEYPVEIEELEKNFVNFIVSNNYIFNSNPIMSKILIYLVTRKNLTQNHLQLLTDSSSGSVSQNLKKLCSMGIVRKLPLESPTIPRIFQVEYASLSYLTLVHRENNFIYDNRPKFEGIKNELVDPHSKIKNENGYNKILTFVNLLLENIEKYQIGAIKFNQHVELLKKFLAKNEK